jgi:anti-anti-sigma factor
VILSRHHATPVTTPWPATGGSAVTVIGSDGAVLSTITRHTERQPGGAALTVVVVTGEVDQDSAPALRAALAQTMRPGRQVCCDVGAVTFCGAAGAHTLLDARHLAQSQGAHFTVRGAHGLTRPVLEVAGLAAVLRPGV